MKSIKTLPSCLAFLGSFAALMTGIGLFTLVSLNIEEEDEGDWCQKSVGRFDPATLPV